MNYRFKKNKMKYLITLVIFVSILFFFICGCVLGKKNIISNNANNQLKNNSNDSSDEINSIIDSLSTEFTSYELKKLSINENALFDSNNLDYKKRYTYDNLEFFYEYDIFNDLIKNTNNELYITDNQYIKNENSKNLIICDSTFKQFDITSNFYNIDFINYKNENNESTDDFNIRDVIYYLKNKDLSNIENIVFVNSYKENYSENENIVLNRKKILNFIYNKNARIKTYFTQFIPLTNEYNGYSYISFDNILQDFFGGLIIPVTPVIKSASLSNSIAFENLLSYIEFYVSFVSIKNSEFISKNHIGNVEEVSSNSNKEVYLTFDDGSCEYTINLLNTLKKYNVKATFFVTNQHPVYNYLFKEIVDSGHSIGAHTFSHNYNIYRSKETYFEDLYKIESIIRKETGSFTKLIRFPGGSNNSTSKKYDENIMKELVKDVEDLGYVYYDWNVSSGDGANISSEQTLNNAMIGVAKEKPQYVILFHDTKINTVNIIEPFIQYLIGTNHKILPLDEHSLVCHMSFNY